MPFSAERLQAIARDYWPSTNEHLLKGEHSPEGHRLHERWEQELKKLDQWWAFLDELERVLPEYTVGDGTATINACFRCVAYPDAPKSPPGFSWVIVGCVSILAPVYTIYGARFAHRHESRTCVQVSLEPLPPEIRKPAHIIARKLEATFGVSALPRDIAETPVPLFTQWKEPPDTTLFHVLFTSVPESLP
jgi:hypothetical protein